MESATVGVDVSSTRLSPWWRNSAILILVLGFSVLIWIAVRSYQDAPPIPARVVGPAGETLFTRDDIVAGQQVYAAIAIPLFYLPAMFFNSASHFSVVDTWRFWIIHLWVEGFFEVFVTAMVAVILFSHSMGASFYIMLKVLR